MAHDACMSNTPFPFKVGDKVRLAEWITGEHVVITAIGAYGFLARPWHDLDSEDAYPQGLNWIRYGAVAA